MSAKYKLLLLHDIFRAGVVASRDLPAMNRVVYCRQGELVMSGDISLSADEARHSDGVMALAAGDDDGVEAWRWELTPINDEPVLDLGGGITTKLIISEPVTTIDPSVKWLMRCDSVIFPPSGCALLHVHAGPGIRCLREGQIRIDTDGHQTDFEPGEAWFEDGELPVFAQAAETGSSRFIRVMILPREFKGKSSIQYVNPEDLNKPKSQRYKGYTDEFIEH